MYATGICAYCGESFGVERDHILAWKRGGTETEQNFTTACSLCNKRKLDITPDEWRFYVGAPFRDGVDAEKLLAWPSTPLSPRSPISEHGLRYIKNAADRKQVPFRVVEVSGWMLTFRYKTPHVVAVPFVGSAAKARKHVAHILSNDLIGSTTGFDLLPALVKVPTETPWGDLYGVL